MKKVLISFTLIVIVLSSCKKNDNATTDPNIDKVEFFSNNSNTLDGIIAKTQIKDSKSDIYFYGRFNAKGLQDSIKSIVLDQRDSSFYCNYIIDSKNRPYLCYTTKKNGNNDNVILKLSYPSSDTVVYSLYHYDWVSKTDSLLQENRINKLTGGNVITYGRVNATEPDLDPIEKEYQDLWEKWKASLTNGLVKVKAISGFNRLSRIWTNTITSAVLNAAIIDAGLERTLTSIRENIVKARTNNSIPINSYEETYGINTNPPQSPSSRFIPNPIGTPQYPTGNSNSSIVTDIDGNIYHAITIGTQTWLVENLKTTRYNDGSSISTGISNNAWGNTIIGCYAIYNDNVTNNATYGKLYNWYAVNIGKLSPTGWHIPTDAEWTILINYLGGYTVAGGKMKTATSWNNPNTDATNSSGFSGLPAGIRNGNDGLYIYMSISGLFWSSTSYNTVYAWTHLLSYNQSGVVRNYNSKTNGLAVRCIKN